MGNVHGQEKWNLYRNASLFVLLSYGENFANSVLEAMSVGCPVVVTKDVGLAETVGKNDCGVIVEDDPVKAAKSINRLLDNENLRYEMGANGMNVVKEEFSWDKLGKRMIEKYKRIMSEKSALQC